MQTVKEFLKGTRNGYHINITQGNNDNVVFDGTYAELKANEDTEAKTFKEYLSNCMYYNNGTLEEVR